MDFSTLMKQAAANKVLNEKMYERKKQSREQLKAKNKAIEEERRRIIKAKLKKFNEEAIRQRMQYKGIPLTSSSGSATPPATTTDIKDSNSASKQWQAPKPAMNDSTPFSQSSKTLSATAKGPSDRSMDRKTSTSPKPSPKAPVVRKSVNFQDMMKLAQKNMQEKVTLGAPSLDTVGRKKSPSPISPGKKSMADKNREAAFSHKMSQVVPGITTAANGLGRNSKKSALPIRPTVSSKQSSNLHSSLSKSQRSLPAKPASSGLGSADSKIGSKSNIMINGREEKVTCKQKKMPPGQKSDSFYGAASTRLAKDGRPKFSTQRDPVKYTSSWVDQMAEFMQTESGKGFDDEDDKDDCLDDFVVDDDDSEYDGHKEYSSVIQEIFGYDSRRFADDPFDDEVMESSYNQQQFEEIRSARIGQMEDEEDMRREQEEMARKRKRKFGGKGTSKRGKKPR